MSVVVGGGGVACRHGLRGKERFNECVTAISETSRSPFVTAESHLLTISAPFPPLLSFFPHFQLCRVACFFAVVVPLRRKANASYRDAVNDAIFVNCLLMFYFIHIELFPVYFFGLVFPP